jgi:exodeoxyribonuclease-1
MAKSFFFYDLETSGFDPRYDRIMQFAGQRTDLDLKPFGEPVNFMIKITEDTLPSPDALLVTRITPQQTLEVGYSEAEASRIILSEIFTEDTIAVGFNNIRFDDEFIRHLLWRNFYDPYEWSWQDGRSRWDMLDVIRMTRALRPEGIEWPLDSEGKATNRLELLTAANGLNHYKAHDALSDVLATIDVANLIKTKQPQLFNYLLDMRDKNKIKKLVNLEDKKPFVYVSGKYSNEYNKATVAFPLSAGPNGSVIVYDLRVDPVEFLDLNSKQISEKVYADWETRKSEGFVPLPIKQLAYNKCPSVAPLGVLKEHEGWSKIGMDEQIVSKNMQILVSRPDFAENVRSVFENKKEYPKSPDVEGQLYDGFLADVDKLRCELIRNAKPNELADLNPAFSDERLDSLLLHYKARSFPNTLTEEESMAWERWRAERIKKQLPKFIESIQRISKTKIDDESNFVLQELQLYAESVISLEE